MSMLDQLQLTKSPTRWLFLITASYAFLYCCNTQFPTQLLVGWLWDILVPKFADLVGDSNFTRVAVTGSGDTYFDFYRIGLFLVLAVLIGSGLYFVLKKEKNFQTLKKGIFLLVRYYVIYQMMLYGLAKIFYLQFQFPSDLSLEKRFGDMSPMGLLWNFMGYSKGYTMFTGWLEFLGGFFLIFRRTTVLGSLITLGVMLNVFMLNIFYDVPVKLLSGHIVLLSLFLLLPMFKDLYKYFFTNENFERSKYPFFDYYDSGKVMLGFKLGLIVIFCTGIIGRDFSNGRLGKEDLLFSDRYDVINFERYSDGKLLENPEKAQIWDYTTSMYKTYLAVQTKNDRGPNWYKVKEDRVESKIELTMRDDTTTYELTYKERGRDSFQLYGAWFGDSISMDMIKSKEQFLLKSRKFRWIQDYPFNR